MSLFGTLVQDAFSVIQSNAGELVSYSSDGVTYESITAVPGMHMSPETPMGGNTIVTARTFDWMIAKANLPVSEPKRGNIIIRSDGRRYRVNAPNGGACWRWSGPYETYYRIQTIAIT